MNDLIAKKYVKAIAARADIDEFYKNLELLNSAFSSPKFRIIMEFTRIKKEKKLELLSSFFTQISPSFKNFLRLLIQNSRLSCIPEIFEELEKEIHFKKNIHLGIVYTKENLNEESLRKLEEKLGIRFNTTIKLKNQLSQNNEARITLEELDYEIFFSMKTIQSKMSEFILKNI